MIQTALFFVLAAVTIVSALLVVTMKNVFHAALWLVVSLASVGGIYAMLAADFLFSVQLLVYVGGITVLLLFVILLSGKPSDWAGRQVNEKAWAAGLFSFFLVVALGNTIIDWPVLSAETTPLVTTGRLGQLLIHEMALPLEVISLVLVAALVGSIYFSVRKPS